MKSIENGGLGIHSLLEYFKTGQKENLIVVKNTLFDVKLWLLIQSYINNIDTFYYLIPDKILNNLFQTEEKYSQGYPWYQSNLKEFYTAHLIMLRNAFAHKKFTIENDIITIYADNQFYSKFNLIWFQQLCLALLNNKNFLLKNGMQSNVILSNSRPIDDSIEKFLEFLKSDQALFIKFTVQKENRDIIKEDIDHKSSKIKYLFQSNPRLYQYIYRNVQNKESNKNVLFGLNSVDDINFGIFEMSLMEYLQSYISAYSPNENIKKKITQDYKEIGPLFASVFKLDIWNVDYNDPIFKDRRFITLPYEAKMQLLLNRLSKENKLKKNYVDLTCLLEFLNIIDDAYDINEDMRYYYSFNKELLIKAFASILFVNYGSTRAFENKSHIIKDYQYKMDLKTIYAKSVFSMYIKELQKSLKDLKEFGASSSQKRKCNYYLKMYLKELKTVEDENSKYHIFRLLRNALIHDYVEFSDGYIKFYAKEPSLNVLRYNEKKGKWNIKTIGKDKLLYELIMKEDDFIDFIMTIYSSFGFEVRQNALGILRKRGLL